MMDALRARVDKVFQATILLHERVRHGAGQLVDGLPAGAVRRHDPGDADVAAAHGVTTTPSSASSVPAASEATATMRCSPSLSVK